MIAWNNAELLARVEATLEQYKGVTYDDSQIATAESGQGAAHAFCKALNDERIRIGKVYNAPYEKFKGEVDEVLQKVKGTVAEIDAQVKAFEERKQQESRTRSSNTSRRPSETFRGSFLTSAYTTRSG